MPEYSSPVLCIGVISLDFIYFLFIAVFLIGARFFIKGINPDYISHRQTQCINGFFVLLVFIQHYKSYVKIEQFDMVYDAIGRWNGQLIVVPFLFFSGYGIMLSITKKGTAYVNSIMTKRFPKIWVHFAIAVSLFVITNAIMGKSYDPWVIFFSFFGWEGIGNSNWYIFDTLVLYILTFFSFRFVGKNYKSGLYIMGLLTLAFIVTMSFFKQPYWYNTAISYFIGMFFAVIEPHFRKWISASHMNYLIFATVGIIAIVFSSMDKNKMTAYEVFVLAGIVLLLAISLKVKFGNPILSFLGKNVFEIYILQRIPMIVFRDIIPDKYVYFIVCFAATIPLALLFRFVEKGADWIIDGKFLKKKSKTDIKA